MIRTPLAALALVAASAAAMPAHAFDPADMNDAEREAFGAAVRDYLIANPDVIVEAIGALEDRQAASAASTDEALIAQFHDEIFADDHSWIGGNPDGDLTIVEFYDYRCPYCRKAAPDLDRVTSRDGNIRVILKEFPILGEQSEKASRFALSVRALAGDDAYKAAHDALMASKANITPVVLRAMAVKLDLDAEAVLAGMDDDAVSRQIADNRALAQRLRIAGTPTFIIGERMVRGAPPGGLQEIVDGVRKDRDGN